MKFPHCVQTLLFQMHFQLCRNVRNTIKEQCNNCPNNYINCYLIGRKLFETTRCTVSWGALQLYKKDSSGVKNFREIIQQVNRQLAVWKFKKFNAILILREINLRDLKSLKSAILKLLEALNFVFDKFLPFYLG